MSPRRLLLAALTPLALLLALALPAGAGAATQLEIVNDTGRGDVYVTLDAPGAYNVEGAAQDVPQPLGAGPLNLTVNQMVSGRVYVSFGNPVKEGEPFTSPTRFDWGELTVTPSSTDVANLTAVDQFAIGMRMEAVNGAGETLETIGEANADTIFDALQQIPGGPAATVRNSAGEIVRVLSPVHSTAYPDLGEYVRSMAGQTITLHTAFYGTPFTVTEYSGSFAADGSLTLHGTYNSASPPFLAEPPPPTIEIPAAQLIPEIYAPVTHANNTETAIRRDVLAGFSTGFWGGRYGNNALSFCSNPELKPQGWICPNGFNQPAFGDARASLSPFPTCNQYAAVINQYSDSYGSAYSDAAKKTTVSLNPATTAKLRLTILPDSGTEMPVHSGNPNCGAAPPSPPAPPSPAPSSSSSSSSTATATAVVSARKSGRPKIHFLKRDNVRRNKVRVARLFCGTACGRIVGVAKHGKRVVARVKARTKSAKPFVVLHLTRPGRLMLVRSHRLATVLRLSVRPAGARWSHYRHKVLLGPGRATAAHRSHTHAR